MMARHMLSTIDNPFDPFTQFDEWYAFDVQAGHHTSAYLARVVRTSYDISEADQDLAIEHAIDEIVRENILGIYLRVPEPNTNDSVPDNSITNEE